MEEMSQQIINIPINWDDDAIKRCIEKGVIEEVKNEIKVKALDVLGFGRYGGYSSVFESVIKECFKEVVEDKKDYIIEEIIRRCTKSIKSSKVYQEAKDGLE